MKCAVCNKKLNAFSKGLKFGKQTICPLCGADTKMGLNWKVFILYAIVGILIIAVVNAAIIHSPLFRITGNAITLGIAVLQGLELKFIPKSA